MQYLKSKLLYAPFLSILASCSTVSHDNYTGSLSGVDPIKSASSAVSAVEKGISPVGNSSASNHAAKSIESIGLMNSSTVKSSDLMEAVSKVSGHSQNSIRPAVAHIRSSASKYEIPPALLAALIHRESSFKQSARSSSGAVGLTQVMPKYWSRQCDSIWTAKGNIDCGAKILSTYLKSAEGDWKVALAFYNVGPNNYEKSAKMRRVGDNYAKMVMDSQYKIESHITSKQLTAFIDKNQIKTQ